MCYITQCARGLMFVFTVIVFSLVKSNRVAYVLMLFLKLSSFQGVQIRKIVSSYLDVFHEMYCIAF